MFMERRKENGVALEGQGVGGDENDLGEKMRLQSPKSLNGKIFRPNRCCYCLWWLPDFIPWAWFHQNKRQ